MDVMKLFDALRGLHGADFDLGRMGAWPVKVKAALMALLFAAALGGGHALSLSGMALELERLKAAERALRQEQAQQLGQAAQMGALRAQHQAVAAVLADWRQRLPAGDGVPDLLEDIGQAAKRNGLRLEGLELASEQRKEFYAELPFALRVVGGYHQIGVFVSALADLPRLVTLHDFALRPNRSNAGLQLQISAKTYTYLGENQ